MEKRELAQACRPTTLNEVWGNEEAVSVLTGFLSKESRPQSYLFTGDAGTGKTTMARAYAHDLNVEPIDLIEINASDHTGVDDMRNLIETLQYAGFGDRRAVILDEAHYLSANAQSSILKLLEEPPADVYIMLATTNPEKLSTAIKTRCIQIVSAPLDEELLIKKLRKIRREEDIDVTIDILEEIAEKSEGVPRKALKLLDKVSGMSEEKALKILATEVSEDTENPDVRAICTAFLNRGTWKSIANNIKNVKNSDVEGVRRQIAGYLSAVLVNSENAKAACALGYFVDSFFNSGYSGLVYSCYCALTECSSL